MRDTLPAKSIARPPLWTLIKNFIGKDLIRISMPVVLNEPLTFLQKACEAIQYCHLLQEAHSADNPIERMELVCAFATASISSNSHRLGKPFNPLLYETYETELKLGDGSVVKAFAQQVCHHPPITAGHIEHENFAVDFHVCPKIKFWGKSIQILPEGVSSIYLKKRKERYVANGVSCSVHNIIIGKIWFEHVGPLKIECIEANTEAQLDFKSSSWFGNDLHKFEGNIFIEGNKVRFVFGKWTEFIKSLNVVKQESASSSTSVSLSSTSDITGSDTKSTSSKKDGDKRSLSASKRKSSYDHDNARLLYEVKNEYLEDYYNFTVFTMSLNELTPNIRDKLPRTDSRLRPDVRKLEDGDIDGASKEKERLEDKQRAARARDARFKDPSDDFLWFNLQEVPFTKDKFWVYNGQYWDSDKKSEKFPDIF